MIPFESGDVYRKVLRKNVKSGEDELHVHYRMTRKAHHGYTWGKKKSDGTPMFKSRYYKAKMGEGGGEGGRTKGTKQYFCKNCKKAVDIERDNSNNAYCCECGNKMFG